MSTVYMLSGQRTHEAGTYGVPDVCSWETGDNTTTDEVLMTAGRDDGVDGIGGDICTIGEDPRRTTTDEELMTAGGDDGVGGIGEDIGIGEDPRKR